MIDIVRVLIDKAPWLLTAVFSLLAAVVVLVIAVVAYALRTGRSIRLWNLEIGPRREQTDSYPSIGLNKRLGSLSSDLHELLGFIQDQTAGRDGIPQTDFDPPRFPHYAYWMLEVLIAHGFIVKESIGQRADAPIYSYSLSPDYKKLLGRV